MLAAVFQFGPQAAAVLAKELVRYVGVDATR
jgi:hypothetical protein